MAGSDALLEISRTRKCSRFGHKIFERMEKLFFARGLNR